MTDHYAESLDYLYGRLNYERQGMPRSPGELRLGRMRRLLRAAGRPAGRPPDRPRRRHQRERLDGGDDRRGPLGLGRPHRALLLAAPATGWKSGSTSMARAATPDELIALTDAVRPAVDRLDADQHASPPRGADVLRDHHGDGLAPFRPERTSGRSCSKSAWAAGSIRRTSSVRPCR